jgi:hypothetical protein
MAEELKENLRTGLWFGAYVGLVSTILRLIFTEAFSLPFSVAVALAIFITLLGAYPIFERGTTIRRRFRMFKGEHSGFLDILVLSTLLSLAIYVLARFFGWK